MPPTTAKLPRAVPERRGKMAFPPRPRMDAGSNLDFEKGDLTDWTATGDGVRAISRSKAIPSTSGIADGTQQSARALLDRHLRGSTATTCRASLTSIPFKVTHPYASFLVGGGSGKRRSACSILDEKRARSSIHASGRHERRYVAPRGRRSHAAAGQEDLHSRARPRQALVGGM